MNSKNYGWYLAACGIGCVLGQLFISVKLTGCKQAPKTLEPVIIVAPEVLDSGMCGTGGTGMGGAAIP